MKMVSAAWTQPPHATDPNGSYLPATSFPFVTLEFAYDGLSRRVQKKTIKNGAVEMEGYVYDGWNVLMISNLDPYSPHLSLTHASFFSADPQRNFHSETLIQHVIDSPQQRFIQADASSSFSGCFGRTHHSPAG